MNFHVTDHKWNQVLPRHYQDRVVCLPCFDYFASVKGIDYHNELSEVIFMGEAAQFNFDIVARKKAMGLYN